MTDRPPKRPQDRGKTDAGPWAQRSSGADRSAPEGGPRSPRSQPVFNAPSVVLWTIAALWAVFALLLVAPPEFVFRFETAAGVSPARFLDGPRANGGTIGMLAPFIGHMAIHAGFVHIAFNSLWLLAFGTPVARRLMNFLPGDRSPYKGGIGSALFLTFFALCGAAGALFFVAFNASQYTLLVGASGGVFGLLGAIVRFAFRKPAYFAPPSTELARLGDPMVIVASIVIIALNMSVIFVDPGLAPADANIAWEAHTGGYLFGLVAFPLFDRAARKA